ncbi:MAG: FtsX-like permease family protein, partial [Chloroflexota bacterium]
MDTPVFFLRTAWHNLLRGGQRVVVAVLCIAFGVMSLTAMTLVSQSFDRAMVLEPSEQIGADISLERQAEAFILPEHVEALEALRQAGEIDRYTLIAFTSSLTFRVKGSGEIHFVASGMGIEPDQYPLAGALTLSEPGNVGLPTLLQEAGDVIVTRNVAEEFGLKVGDTIVLADMSTGVPVEGRIRAVASDTPNHQGSKIYYSLATAEQLANRPNAANTAMANAADPEAASNTLSASGWNAFPATAYANNSKDAQELFDTLLKGAGILGLLVGGIGIANTMQVLLRRRQREVAIWKTLGYREYELQALFAIEAALLGTVGSLLGVGSGLAVSFGLVRLFSRSTNLLVSWSFSPYPLVMGGLVGVLTTVIFALWAILITGGAHPMSLLRNEPVQAG